MYLTFARHVVSRSASGAIQTGLSNLGCWSDHLRMTDPKHFGSGVAKPQLADMVRMKMEDVNQTYAASIPKRKLEFLAGVAAYTAYGRVTRRKMLTSVLGRSGNTRELVPLALHRAGVRSFSISTSLGQ